MTGHDLESRQRGFKAESSNNAFWIGAGLFAIIVIGVGSVVLDRRIEACAVGLNVWSSDIRKSMAQISTDPERWTGWGELGYDTTAMHSMLYIVPPTEVRVYWQAPEGDFDRMVPVEGFPERMQGQNWDTPLLYEFDSRCGRARVSWKKDMEEVGNVTPWDRVEERDCNLYKDRPTPKEAGPLPNRR